MKQFHQRKKNPTRQITNTILFILIVSFLINIGSCKSSTRSPEWIKWNQEFKRQQQAIGEENSRPGRDIDPEKQYKVEHGQAGLSFSVRADMQVNTKKCQTPACKTEAGRLICYIDHFAEKKNFYDYACGGPCMKDECRLERDPEREVMEIIKGELNSIDSESPSEMNLKRFYNSCLTYEKDYPHKQRLEIAKQILKSLDLKYAFENESFNLTHTMIVLIQMDSFPLFDVGLEIDEKNYSKLALKLSLPSNGYLFDTQNEKEAKCINEIKELQKSVKEKTDLRVTYKDHYKDCMKNPSGYLKDLEEAVNAIGILGHSKNSSDDKIEMVKTAVERSSIKIFKKIITTRSTGSYSISSDHIREIKELPTFHKMVNWTTLLGALLNKTVNEDEQVQIHFREFEEIFDYFKKPQDVHNALIAHLTHNIYKYFVKDQNTGNSREKFCLKIISRLVPDITSYLLMKKIGVTNTAKQQEEVKKILNSTRQTFFKQIKDTSARLEWPGHITSENINKKAGSFKTLIPLPQPLPSSNTLNSVEDSIKSNYLSYAMYLIQRKQNLIYSLHNKESNSTEVIWLLFARPYSSRSTYIYEMNTLVIPEGVLLKHKYDLPYATTMAHLGFDIASGIIRAFDYKGIYIDYKNEKTDSLITMDDNNAYSNMYGSMKEPNHELNISDDEKLYNVKIEEIYRVPFGEILLNEKFTDIGATKLAFETLKGEGNTEILPWGDFNNHQLYFLTLAQRFCTKKAPLDWFTDLFEGKLSPPYIRMKNIFRNSEDFKMSFNIPAENSSVKPFPYYTKGPPQSLEAV